MSPVIPVLSLGTPPGFAINRGVTKVGGPLSFDNFNSKFISGGFPPENGAIINITYDPLPPPPLDNLIDIELNGADIKTRTSVIISGLSCTQIFYTEDDFSPVQKVEAIYCRPESNYTNFFSIIIPEIQTKISTYRVFNRHMASNRRAERRRGQLLVLCN